MITGEVAERAVEARRRRTRSRSSTRERSLMLRFAAGRPTQSTSIDDVTVEIAVPFRGPRGQGVDERRGRRLARASAPGGRGSRRRAAAAAGDGPASPASTRTRAAAPASDRSTRRPRSSTRPPAPRRWPRPSRRPSEHGVEAHGIWTVAEQEQAWATRGDGAPLERRTDAFMKVICIAPERPQRLRVGDRASWDGEPSGARAGRAGRARRPLAAGEPAELPPGEYPVVFEPQAVGWLCDLLGGLRVQRPGARRGPRRARRAGSASRSPRPAINLADSPGSPADAARARSTPRARAKAPIAADPGRRRARAWRTTSAAPRSPARATHRPRARPGRRLGSGPHPTNLVLAGGGAADEAELCAPVERGVYVTRLWYANVVRPKETLITAVTRDGTFLIEDGQVTRPLRDLRLTDSVLGILSRTQALGREPEAHERRRVLRPPLRLRRRLPRAAGGRGALYGRRRLVAAPRTGAAAIRARAGCPRDLQQTIRSPRTGSRRRSSSGSGCARRASRRRTGPLRCRRRRRRRARRPCRSATGSSTIDDRPRG